MHLMKENYVAIGMKLGKNQFDLLFGALDTNQYGEYNYK